MIPPQPHTTIQVMLERCHKDLHARAIREDRVDPNITRVTCVFKDDGVKERQRGIPPIPYIFDVIDGEDLDKRMETIRLYLEAEIKQLGF